MDKRRFFLKLNIIFFISLFVLLCVSRDVVNADWSYCCSSTELTWYYDAEGINYLQNNIIQVWVKVIPNNVVARSKYSKTIQKELKSDIPVNFSYSLQLYEVNCEDNTLNVLEITHYNDKEEVIYSGKMAETDFSYMQRDDSVGYNLQNTICSSRDLKNEGSED